MLAPATDSPLLWYEWKKHMPNLNLKEQGQDRKNMLPVLMSQSHKSGRLEF